MLDHASTVVGWAKISESVKAAILHATVGENANARTGKQDIGRRVPQSASIIAADVAQNILLCGGSFLGMISIYGNIWLAIGLKSCLESPM